MATPNPPQVVTAQHDSTNVFEGPTDGRQSDDEGHRVSRFRPTYRALSQDEKRLHDAIKAKAVEFEELVYQVKEGRYRSLGLTALEESVMWVIKELTS